jgi:3-dehydroquinate dehydratase/shikimate dehydrogenase
MLCIAVAPESRKLGKVDLLNAAPQCDLIELRLDRLGKEPDIPDMIRGISKPILISCRRKQDGGAWTDTEEERQKMLRTAIIAGPAYIELELDVAESVPRFGKTKRVISYTSTTKPLANLEQIYEKAVKQKADVVKFVGPTPTLEAAWPLLAAVSKKRDVPVVGMGLDQSGLMFSLLGRKHGSPWIYGALEKGLEAYSGQQTVTELEDTYHWKDIGPQTRFIAVIGFGPTETRVVKTLNSAFRTLNLNIRCLPVAIGSTDKLGQMLDALHINVILPNAGTGARVLALASQREEATRISEFADLLVKQPDGWHAFSTLWRSALRAIETSLGAKTPEDRPLDRRNVMLIGAGGLAQSVAFGIQKRKGLMSIASSDDDAAQLMAQTFGARFVPMANMYDTLTDVVVVTEATSEHGDRETMRLNPSYLRPNMTVTDLSNIPDETLLLEESRLRGCKVVEPVAVFREHISAIFKSITGKDLPAESAG